MVKCPECGSVNEDDSKICYKCDLNLIDAIRYMQPEERKKLYVKGTPQRPVIKKVQGIQEVIVKDFDMPFGSMIVLMVKWALASIPAIIILAILVGFAVGLIMKALGTLPG